MKINHGKMELEEFRKLPDRAQELFFEILYRSEPCKDNPYTAFDVHGLYEESCESPIEQLFIFAFNFISFKSGIDLFLTPQAEIETPQGKFRADFLLCQDDNEDRNFGGFMLVIECDGHDFHEKTKEQVARNNERDLALKSAGYDIIHFSGSQIYRNPLGCAKQAVEYIQKKIQI